MENRGRQGTNKIRKYFNNRGNNVYRAAYTQGRAPSPPPSRPSQNFTRTQNIRAAAQPLQEAKRKYARAPSPTRNGARQRVININRTMKNIDRYNNLTGKSNNLHNTSQNLKSKNNESKSWWESFMVFGGTKHKRTNKKRNRTKRNRTKRN
jgi:hypothetical protein